MDSKLKWNNKYKERIEGLKEPKANPRLVSLSTFLNGGTALDLACGLGGNSIFLAKLNYKVDAVDISDLAVNYIQEQSKKYQLSIQPSVYDLTCFNQIDWQEQSFHLIVMTYYLDRSLFPIVKDLIKENGFFFMETYYQTSRNDNRNVSNQYKLKSRELLTEFGDWNVIYFDENEIEGRQTIFCQKK